MLYDISVRLKFTKKGDSDALWVILKKFLKDRDIRSLVEETSFIEYIKSHHDESPPKPCETIERLEK